MKNKSNIGCALIVLAFVFILGAIGIGSIFLNAQVTEEPAQIEKIQPVGMGAEFLADPGNIEHGKGVAEINVLNSEANLNNGLSNAAEDFGSAAETFSFAFLFKEVGAVVIGLTAVIGIISVFWLLGNSESRYG